MKNLWLLPLFIIASILMANFSLADNEVSFVTPANASVTSSTVTLNATISTRIGNVTNVSFYYRNDTSSAWTFITNIRNESSESNQSHFSTTFDSTQLWDDNIMQFNATAIRHDGIIESSNLTTVGIDNGAPTVTFSSNSIADLEDIQSSNGFTIATDSDNTIGVNACRVYMNSQQVSITPSNNACSQILFAENFSITTENSYTYTIGSTDLNGNETNSSSRTLTIYFGGSGGGLGGGGGGGSDSVSVETPKTSKTGTEQSFTGEESESKGNAITRFFSAIVDFFRNLFS